MKVLVACEYSGVVRDNFIRLGYDAISCDLLPSESTLGPHYQGDVRDILNDGFDLLIAHPTCTYLTNSGVRWLYDKKGNKVAKRWNDLDEGAEFFKLLYNAPIPYIAVENPIMHKHAIERIGGFKHNQLIQPYMFGDMEQKATCLWLRNLPLLKETNNVKEEMMKLPKKERQRIHYLSPSENRAKERSKTFDGIGKAIAEQYGLFVSNYDAYQGKYS